MINKPFDRGNTFRALPRHEFARPLRRRTRVGHYEADVLGEAVACRLPPAACRLPPAACRLRRLAAPPGLQLSGGDDEIPDFQAM